MINDAQRSGNTEQQEIEQLDNKEFDLATEHPQETDTHVQSEEIRYKNADRIYE